jgi:hypothetical protein
MSFMLFFDLGPGARLEDTVVYFFDWPVFLSRRSLLGVFWRGVNRVREREVWKLDLEDGVFLHTTYCDELLHVWY